MNVPNRLLVVGNHAGDLLAAEMNQMPDFCRTFTFAVKVEYPVDDIRGEK